MVFISLLGSLEESLGRIGCSSGSAVQVVRDKLTALLQPQTFSDDKRCESLVDSKMLTLSHLSKLHRTSLNWILWVSLNNLFIHTCILIDIISNSHLHHCVDIVYFMIIEVVTR